MIQSELPFFCFQLHPSYIFVHRLHCYIWHTPPSCTQPTLMWRHSSKHSLSESTCFPPRLGRCLCEAQRSRTSDSWWEQELCVAVGESPGMNEDESSRADKSPPPPIFSPAHNTWTSADDGDQVPSITWDGGEWSGSGLHWPWTRWSLSPGRAAMILSTPPPSSQNQFLALGIASEVAARDKSAFTWPCILWSESTQSQLVIFLI